VVFFSPLGFPAKILNVSLVSHCILISLNLTFKIGVRNKFGQGQLPYRNWCNNIAYSSNSISASSGLMWLLYYGFDVKPVVDLTREH
jgi:hypothetical protein